MYRDDTIAAISTAAGTGGIGIVRISGEDAVHIADSLFHGVKSLKHARSHTMSYGKIIDPATGETVDEVLVSIMKRPQTFTREDIAEINCHGGMVVTRRVLELALGQGARLAEPGEFTKRAFLNGRIDLSQAEAVIDLITARTEISSKVALRQLEGGFSYKIGEIRKKLISLIAHIEVTVDYPEHDIEEITGKMVNDELIIIKTDLNELLNSFDRGRILREGISVVLVGRPNVGKSSLLNELSGKNRAIVTDIPGTTRDIIEEYINIGGIPASIFDTAGIRATGDPVEKLGVEKTQTAIGRADLIILIIDAYEGILREDIEILESIRAKRSLVLLNKIDLVDEAVIGEFENQLQGINVLRISAKEGTGLDKLEQAISDMFQMGLPIKNDEILLTNIRHKQLLDKTAQSIEAACEAYETGMPLDCITIDIRSAAEQLGQITGESANEEVLHHIFSRFCVGK